MCHTVQARQCNVGRSTVGGAWVRRTAYDCAKTLCSLIGKTRVRCLDIDGTRVRLSSIDKNAGSPSGHWDNAGSPFSRRDNEGSPFGHRQNTGSFSGRRDNEGSPSVHPGGFFSFKRRESAPGFPEWQKCEPQLMFRAAPMRTAPHAHRLRRAGVGVPGRADAGHADPGRPPASWIAEARILVSARVLDGGRPPPGSSGRSGSCGFGQGSRCGVGSGPFHFRSGLHNLRRSLRARRCDAATAASPVRLVGLGEAHR